LGIIIIFIPVFLYLKLNGILNAFYAQVILGGAARGFSADGLKEFVKNFYIVISRNFCTFPLCIGIFLCLTKFKQTDFSFYLGYTLSYLLMILFLSFANGDSHYNMVLIPFFIPALVFLIDILHSAFSKNKYKDIVLVLFLCIIFSEGLARYFYNISKIFHDNSGSQLFSAGKMIDENTMTGDKIISLGFTYIYPFTKRDIVSKYFYQGSGLNFISGSRDEFLSDVLTNKPAIIALFVNEDGIDQTIKDWYNPIFAMIEKNYRILSDEYGFILYIRND
jgi:hypothetical protein